MPIFTSGAISPCLVTGNIQILSSGVIGQGTVTFQLYNITTGTIPQILGIASLPNLKFQVQTDQTGFFTTTLWGNDVINPANTQYLVTFRDYYGNTVGPVAYSIQGNAVNLNTASAATSTTPPVYSQTAYAAGTSVASNNFGINGWGVGAVITAVSGVQQRCSISLTAGTGPTISPTVTFTYPVPYPTTSWNLGQMTGGTGMVSDLSISSTNSFAVFTYLGLPSATSTYIFVFDTLGF